MASRTSKFCRPADLDTVFVAADSAREVQADQLLEKAVRDLRPPDNISGKGEAAVSTSRMTALIMDADEKTRRKKGAVKPSPNVLDRKKALGRVEFILALVHIAILRYVLPGLIPDISQALDELLKRDIFLKIGVTSLPAPDALRRCYCYTRTMNSTLRKHEVTLRRLFVGLAEGRKSFKLERWMDFLRTIGMIADDVSERDAIRAFAWSRMVVINDETPAGYLKDNSLPFEGFMEALIRLSILKALPTPEEIEEAGQDDAYGYLQALEEEDATGEEPTALAPRDECVRDEERGRSGERHAEAVDEAPFGLGRQEH